MGFGHRVYRAYDPRATRAEAHGDGARLRPRRGRRSARGGCAQGAAREVARPAARDERRVLGRGRARHRRHPRRPDARDVRLRARRRLVCAHPRAEAHRPSDPSRRALHRAAAALGRRRQIVTQTPTAKKSVQLSGVVVAESSVSSIDPDAGVLMYRGYDIADIAEHSTYEDTAYLLLARRAARRARPATRFARELRRADAARRGAARDRRVGGDRRRRWRWCARSRRCSRSAPRRRARPIVTRASLRRRG